MDRAGSIDSLFRLLFVKYTSIGSGSILIYDYLLTLGDEALLVWPSPWGVGKIFFFLTRYPALLDTVGLDYRLFAFSLPQQTCTILASISGVSTIALLIVAELIMTVRVWAMWDRSKRLAIFLGAVIVIVVALSTVMFAKFASNYRYIDPSTATIPPMRGCHPEHGNNLSFVSFTALLGFELLMFALTIIKALPELMKKNKPTGFLRRLYWDGVLYYAVLSVVSLVNVVILVVGPKEFSVLGTRPQRTLSIISSRLLLRLREDAHRRQQAGTITGPLSDSFFETTRRSGIELGESRRDSMINWFGDANSNVVASDPEVPHRSDQTGGESLLR